jgi:hypothetical protein
MFQLNIGRRGLRERLKRATSLGIYSLLSITYGSIDLRHYFTTSHSRNAYAN